jgi:hypothetical protein
MTRLLVMITSGVEINMNLLIYFALKEETMPLQKMKIFP